MIRKYSKAILGFFLVTILSISANAQLNFNSKAITFRTSATANTATTHYGDLNLDGGSTGTSWGWLSCNRMNCWGDGYFSNQCVVGGNFIVYGVKNFIQPHPTDTTKAIKYIAIESGEALTIVRGTSKTIDGEIKITLPEHFSLVTSDIAPITVITTPEMVPALLYVKAKSKGSITVAEKQSDHMDFGDVTFSYQVTGVREGYENEEPIVDLSSLGNTEGKGVSAEKQAKRKQFSDRLNKAYKIGIKN